VPLDDYKSSWYQIFERVFQSANEEHTLETILEMGEQKRRSILLEVSAHLSSSLTDAWSTFSPEKKNIKISFEINAEGGALQIYIEEAVGKQSPKAFYVTDRSKGFIWYYNFIMKTRFNPKQKWSAGGNTVFLLDEPGSYLHETAQADLCKKLLYISQREGVVIYCTHSPQLLLPKHIPYSSLLIVEKTGGHTVVATPVSLKNNTKSVRRTAMQPVYEALMIPEYTSASKDDRILCVEGIYDKYCIEIFCDLSKCIRILPAVSADAILNNIPYFIAYQITYMALWDNDREGKKVHGKARKVFGPEESERFFLLPDVHSKGNVSMERMIENEDFALIRSYLGLAENATYETVIQTLYAMIPKKRQSVLAQLSPETTKAFKALTDQIARAFPVK
jgi:predicted ATP-dependent endonuclease of OLD family